MRIDRRSVRPRTVTPQYADGYEPDDYHDEFELEERDTYVTVHHLHKWQDTLQVGVHLHQWLLPGWGLAPVLLSMLS